MTADFGQIQFERHMNATPERVYQALTDAQDRMAWGAPDTGSVYVIDAPVPLEPGMRETGRVGPRDNPYVDVTVDWILLDGPSRMVYVETLSAEREPLGISTATFELVEDGSGTALRVTVQIVNFSGDEMGDEMQAGWSHAMDALAAHLA